MRSPSFFEYTAEGVAVVAIAIGTIFTLGMAFRAIF